MHVSIGEFAIFQYAEYNR